MKTGDEIPPPELFERSFEHSEHSRPAKLVRRHQQVVQQMSRRVAFLLWQQGLTQLLELLCDCHHFFRCALHEARAAANTLGS